MKFTAISPENGVVGGENVSTEKQKTESSPNPWGWGRGEIKPPKKRKNKKEKKKSYSPVPLSEWPKHPDHPRLRALGDRQEKPTVMCPN